MNKVNLAAIVDLYVRELNKGLSIIGDTNITPTQMDRSKHIDEIEKGDFLRHLLYMCVKIRNFVQEGREDKINRWLCFVQGCLFAVGHSTIDEFREENILIFGESADAPDDDVRTGLE